MKFSNIFVSFLLRYNNQMVSILILPSVVPFNPSVTLSYSTCSYPLFLMKGWSLLELTGFHQQCVARTITCKLFGSQCNVCLMRLSRITSRNRSFSSGVIVCSLAYMCVTLVWRSPFANFFHALLDTLYVSPMFMHQMRHFGDCRIHNRCIIWSSSIALLKFYREGRCDCL